MNAKENEKILHELERENLLGKFSYLKLKVAVADAVLSSKYGQDVDALALAEDIINDFYYHGHTMFLDNQAPTHQALRDLVDRVGPSLKFDDPYAGCL